VKSVYVVQHTPHETLGSAAAILQSHQVQYEYIQPFKGDRVPSALNGRAGLIVMGGPMGVYESAKYPYLHDEMLLIESALASGRPVLGVCLGSQLLASVLGAEVKRGANKELGWHAVTLMEAAHQDPIFGSAPDEFWPFHWHGDVFPLPGKATGLAASGQTACQAFRFGDNAYGILFHLEVTAEQVNEMLSEFADELSEAGGDAASIRLETPQRLPAVQGVADQVFGRWAYLVDESQKLKSPSAIGATDLTNVVA
jgi:GMP synthase (glutamine-hydrolysing)